MVLPRNSKRPTRSSIASTKSIPTETPSPLLPFPSLLKPSSKKRLPPTPTFENTFDSFIEGDRPLTPGDGDFITTKKNFGAANRGLGIFKKGNRPSQKLTSRATSKSSSKPPPSTTFMKTEEDITTLAPKSHDTAPPPFASPTSSTTTMSSFTNSIHPIAEEVESDNDDFSQETQENPGDNSDTEMTDESMPSEPAPGAMDIVNAKIDSLIPRFD